MRAETSACLALVFDRASVKRWIPYSFAISVRLEGINGAGERAITHFSATGSAFERGARK